MTRVFTRLMSRAGVMPAPGWDIGFGKSCGLARIPDTTWTSSQTNSVNNFGTIGNYVAIGF